MSQTNYSLDGRNAIKVSLINENLSYLLGQILTIIDASVDGEKNKAIKDLVKERFSNQQDIFTELAWKEDLDVHSSPAEPWENSLVLINTTNN